MFVRRAEMKLVRRLVQHMIEVGRSYNHESYGDEFFHVRATVCDIPLDHWKTSFAIPGEPKYYKVLAPEWMVFCDQKGRPHIRGDRVRFLSEMTLFRLAGVLDG